MRMDAAYSATTMDTGRRAFLAAPAMNTDLTLEAIDRKHARREGAMFKSNDASRRLRRYTLGAALAVLALFLTPALLGQQSVAAGHAAMTPRIEQRAAAPQTAPAPLAPATAAQEDATQAPAAFSDALAAAPAGAQCNMEAHSCSVPSAAGVQALNPGETAVAFGFSQTMRGASHNERL
ncbi:MAG: hypothetical protein HDR50_06480 [Desulfovibrio sp.]|uniref:hypothetical protein n=1 Tax=Desulfovibrio sp. TaxID=885 RepID=UPI001A7DC273|nr:hypothetical protein [Desulfovibrio sp.]MBD5417296.1 hypothetical protein [Desulfovibrio sp.]